MNGYNRFAPVKEGDELDVKIEALGDKGDGIAKKDGFVLVIPGTQVNDEVRVRVTKVLRRVGFAEVIGKSEGEAEQPKEEAEQAEEKEKPEETVEETKEEPAEEPAEAPEEPAEEETPEEKPEEKAEETEEKEESSPEKEDKDSENFGEDLE